jgi:hypothetical protein
MERKITEALIAAVDAAQQSPQQRAEAVYAYLQGANFTNWDIVCFCGEYLALMIAALPYLEEPARDINRRIYTAHYLAESMDRERASRYASGAIQKGDSAQGSGADVGTPLHVQDNTDARGNENIEGENRGSSSGDNASTINRDVSGDSETL